MKHIGHKRERDEGFFDWVRTQPEWRCIITDYAHDPRNGYIVERCHIASRGAGGSDKWIMPLIREEHLKADTNERSWWYSHKREFAEWCVNLPVLWERYNKEKYERMVRS